MIRWFFIELLINLIIHIMPNDDGGNDLLFVLTPWLERQNERLKAHLDKVKVS